MKYVRTGVVGLVAVSLSISAGISPYKTWTCQENAKFTSEIDTSEAWMMSSGVGSVFNNFEGSDMMVAAGETQNVAQGQAVEDNGQSICGFTNVGVAIVEEGNLNVREGASTDTSVVGKLTNNAVCEVVSTEGEWTQISSGNVSGYVLSSFIKTGAEARQIALSQKKLVATVQTDGLRMRETPSTDADVIERVGNGEDLEALSQIEDGWVKVAVGDLVGYVSAEYVELGEKVPTAKTISELRYGAGVSNVRVDLVSNACQYVGNPYVWGGTSLTKGADCSGFVLAIYRQYGIYLPHYSGAQANCGTHIKASEAQPGDLFFYGSGRSISHVAIYIGNGQIVHASTPRTGIIISNAYFRSPICVTRLLD